MNEIPKVIQQAMDKLSDQIDDGFKAVNNLKQLAKDDGDPHGVLANLIVCHENRMIRLGRRLNNLKAEWFVGEEIACE